VACYIFTHGCLLPHTSQLELEFKGLFRKKPQDLLESRIKVYIFKGQAIVAAPVDYLTHLISF
jgi:hypothetical protein